MTAGDPAARHRRTRRSRRRSCSSARARGLDAASAVGARRAPVARRSCGNASPARSPRARRPRPRRRRVVDDDAASRRATARTRCCARLDLDVPARRDRRGHGPQRRRQVDAARAARRSARRPRPEASTCRASPPHTLDAAAAGAPRRAGAARSRRRCSTSAPSTTSARPPTSEHGLPAGHDARDARPHRARRRSGARIRATCPRGSGSRSRSPSCWRRRRRCVLLDEPTRGLDYAAKARLAELLARARRAGHAVVLATHDVELVAEAATRAIVLADGEVVADGPAREVVCHSPVFAPQVAKVLAPGGMAHRRRGRSGAGVDDASRRPRRGVSDSDWRTGALLAVDVVGRRRRVHVAACSRRRAAPRTSPTPATRRGCSWCSLPLLVAILLAELADGALDAKAVALLGVLVACGAALRTPGAASTGFTGLFFLLIPGGRVFGRGFGFVLGALTMFASALLTGGVGPWLPFQMLVRGVGRLLRRMPSARARTRASCTCSRRTARCRASCTGSLMDMWFWPFATSGTRAALRRGRAGRREPAAVLGVPPRERARLRHPARRRQRAAHPHRGPARARRVAAGRTPRGDGRARPLRGRSGSRPSEVGAEHDACMSEAQTVGTE